MSLRTHKLLSTALFVSVSLGAAQTAPAQPAPAPAVAPKPATPATPAKPTAPTSAATSKVVSAAAISVNQALKGQFVSCPAALKVTHEAVCLYVKSPAASVRPVIKNSLGNLALGDWKMSGQASSLLVRESATGDVGGYVLLTSLRANESLVVLDAAKAKAKAMAAKPVTPAGVVKGQPYVLGSDLAGVVNVLDLGGGKYRLNVAGQTAITVTAGIKTAQRAGGNIELPMAPATDGKNLIFPVSALRSLGCTVTDAANGMTIACGSDSVGVRPIVF